MDFFAKLKFWYGFFMGTSVQYVKAQRPSWPVRISTLAPQLHLLEGGTHNCGIVVSDPSILLLDTGSGQATGELKAWLAKNLSGRSLEGIVHTHLHADSAGGDLDFAEVKTVWRPRTTSADQGGAGTVIVERETELSFGDETLTLVYYPHAASNGDLVVSLKKAQVVFLGELFFNRVHPILRSGENWDVGRWLEVLAELRQRFQPRLWIGADGPPGTDADLDHFADYLRDLRNPQIEFSECRKLYDWTEIPGFTSLEENFDLIRSNQKTHVSVREFSV